MGTEKVLIVEDDRMVMRVLTRSMEGAGYEVVGAPNSTTAMIAARTARPDVIILDLSLIDRESFDSIRDGFGLLEWIRRCMPDTNFPVIVHTMDDSPQVKLRARTAGVHGVLIKGCDPGELLAAVRQALDQAKSEEMNPH